MDEYGINYAILLPRAFATMFPNPDFAAVVAAGYNDWLADVWLDNNNADGRCKGSITVAPQDPLLAVKEIERWAGHPHMVQVMMMQDHGHPTATVNIIPFMKHVNIMVFP